MRVFLFRHVFGYTDGLRFHLFVALRKTALFELSDYLGVFFLSEFVEDHGQTHKRCRNSRYYKRKIEIFESRIDLLLSRNGIASVKI